MTAPMMAEALKKATPTVKPSRKVSEQPRAALAERTPGESLFSGPAERSLCHDLSRVSIHPPSSQPAIQSCPLAAGPRACPFGGACHTCPTQVQAKLAVGQPDDVYEREAERLAQGVMSWSQAQPLPRTAGGGSLNGSPSAPPVVDQVLRSPGRPLDPATRAFFEPRFGHDFSQVRVHTDARAAESARAVGALAYTVGRDVVFGAGQYAPRTSDGQRLVAHELTHVVQQRDVNTGFPSPTRDRPADRFEREAESASNSMSCEQVSALESTSTQSIQRQAGGAGGAAPATHRFAAEGVSVVIRAGCAATLGFAAVEAATRIALDRIFNSACIEESRRTRIQRNLVRHGLDIRCAALAGCAEATGFSIPANIMTLNTTRTNCPPLESSILHEIVHLTRGVFAERLPESCDNSCLGTPRGVPPDLCRDIDVFGRRVPLGPGDFPLPPEGRRLA